MNQTVALRTSILGVAGALLLVTHGTQAQDWPQWRGPNRDARADGFRAPGTWPKTLTQKWKVTVGEGVATPALVNGRLYVFSREEGTEVTRCLEATTGKELWKDSYDSLGATGPAQGFSGPRSSPAVAAGKVVTVGVRGVVSCLEASTGRVLWRKDDFKAWPNFFVSSSPLIVEELAKTPQGESKPEALVVAQLGGPENGALVAYDLLTGNEKWRATGKVPAYASPVVMTVDGLVLIVAQTDAKLVAVTAVDGKQVWESAAAAAPEGQGGPGGGRGGRGGGRDYRATTPAAHGNTLIMTGQSNLALTFEKTADGITAKELWTNKEKPAQFASPIVKAGLVFGMSAANELFCLDAKTGQMVWSAPVSSASAAPPAREPGGPGAGPGGGPGGGRMRGGGGGYGSIVDAGTVLLALTPSSELVAFEPTHEAFKELARFKVAESPTHAYPVVSGNRIYVKDRDTVTLWALD